MTAFPEVETFSDHTGRDVLLIGYFDCTWLKSGYFNNTLPPEHLCKDFGVLNWTLRSAPDGVVMIIVAFSLLESNGSPVLSNVTLSKSVDET